MYSVLYIEPGKSKILYRALRTEYLCTFSWSVLTERLTAEEEHAINRNNKKKSSHNFSGNLLKWQGHKIF